MRSLCFLLISVAALAARAAPAPLQGAFEIQFDISCEGTELAEVVERVELSASSYQMTETSKGKGIYALLGTAKRTSRGAIVNGVLQPAEFADERTGRDTARAWFDWKAQTITMQHRRQEGHRGYAAQQPGSAVVSSRRDDDAGPGENHEAQHLRRQGPVAARSTTSPGARTSADAGRQLSRRCGSRAATSRARRTVPISGSRPISACR